MILTKLLSANDVGETGSHQAGICIPKTGNFLRFFPPLDPKIKNPDTVINFLGPSNSEWQFRFIYYNGKLFGGTRNEYRLTRMTGFLRTMEAKAGDGIVLSKDNKSCYTIDIVRHAQQQKTTQLDHKWTTPSLIDFPDTIELTFNKSWKLIEK
jgi:hypothetical protein